MIVDNFQQAQTDPERDYHLASRIDRTISLIRDEPEGMTERVSNELTEATEAGIDHEVFTAIENLSEWHIQKCTVQSSTKRDFDLVVDALTALDETITYSENHDWDNVAIVMITHRLRELRQLSGWDDELTEELHRARDLLIDGGILTTGNRSQVLDLLDEIIEISTPEETDIVLDVYSECSSWADSFRDAGDFQAERDVLRRAISLRECLGGVPSEEQEQLIESYDKDIERSNYHSRNASVLRSGIQECREFLSSEKRNEWLRKHRIENRKGRENMTARPSGITPNEIQSEADRLVAWYRAAKQNHSNEETLLMFLRLDDTLTDYNEAVDDEFEALGQNPLKVLLSQSFENKKGDVVDDNPGLFEVLSGWGDELGPVEPDEQKMKEWTPQAYQKEVKKMNAVLSRVLRQLIEQGDLLEADFYRILDRIEHIDPHREAFLTDTIIAFFEEDYTKALHVGVPQFEGILENILELKGERVNKEKPDSTIEPSSLGGLFEIVEKNIDENLGKYLEYQYTESGGMNLRNAIAHGEYPYGAASFDYSAILLYDIFRTLVRVENHYE